MKKIILALGTLVGALVLAGAGCQSSQPASPTDTSMTPPNSDTAMQADMATSTGNSIMLTATTSDTRSVHFTWTTPASVDPHNSFLILYKSTPNPALNEGAYWNRVPGTTRDTTLGNFSAGITHFRVCEFNVASNACVQYSNDVSLDIQ